MRSDGAQMGWRPMTDRRRTSEERLDSEAVVDTRPGDEEDPFEEWERYPAHKAEESMSYQKLAWYGAPFGSAGVTLLLLAAVVSGLRRVVRGLIRLLVRWSVHGHGGIVSNWRHHRGS